VKMLLFYPFTIQQVQPPDIKLVILVFIIK